MPKIIGNDDLKFHYWRIGQKEGEDVVMLHGLGGNLAVWHLTLVPTMRKKYHLLSYDLRGHGRSDSPEEPYTVESIVEDLLVMLDKFGIEKTYLVGHCMGGDIALYFALEHPERVKAIVSIESVLPAIAKQYVHDDWYGWKYIAEIFETVMGTEIPAESATDIEFLLRQLLEVPVAYGPSKGRRRNEEPIKRLLEALTLTRDAPDELREKTLVGRLTVDNLKLIETPVMLLYEADTLFRPSQEILQRELPNAQTVYLPESKMKHLSALEHPKLISAYTEAYFEHGHVNDVNPDDFIKVDGDEMLEKTVQ